MTSTPVPSLKAVLQSIRELTYDRFGVPGLVIKAATGVSIFVDSTGIHLTGPTPASTPPTAVAGPSQIVVLPFPEPTEILWQYNLPAEPTPPVPDVVTITLDGSGSTAAGSNQITGYQWRMVTGPDVAVFSDANNVITEVTIAEGLYVFELLVVDNNGLTATDMVKVLTYDPSVTALQVVAGADRRFPTSPGTGSLACLAVSPLSNAIAAYQWTKVSGPVAGSLMNATSYNPSLSGLVQGVYVFSVLVTDSAGNTATDTVSVIVSPLFTTDYLFSEFPTFADLVSELQDDNVQFAYTGYYNGEEPTGGVVPMPTTPLLTDTTIYRRFFFSDETVMQQMVYYYYDVLRVHILPSSLQAAIPDIRWPSQYHLALWVSYYLVNDRRRYEAAAQMITNQMADPNATGINYSDANASIQVNIGDVFSITEDPQTGFVSDNFQAVGSDNVWGDRYSFWYKLMLYLRSRLEEDFGDYELRMDTVFEGGIILDKPQNFRAYYDSYPFTLSPLARQIISYTPQ